MLNGSNFKIWKENVEIVLGCMELDLALRMERATSTSNNLNESNIEKWERSNRLSIMLMKCSIPEAFWGSINESVNAMKFLLDIEQFFAKNKKLETSTLLRKLVGMKYIKMETIREYIMEMSDIVEKLKAFKLQLSDDLLVHLVLISLPAQFSQFIVSYNTQKDKWTLNELISHCVQEKERIKKDKTESAHLALISQKKKRKRAKDSNKDTTEGISKQKKGKTQHKEFTCYFCKKAGHFKKECPKFVAWRIKKGTLLTLVCSEVNLTSVPSHTWWVDYSTTTHVSISLQGCLWSRPPNGSERFIYVGDGKTAKVEAIGTFRLLLKTGAYLDLKETYVVMSFRQNLISISVLDKSGYYCSFGNSKFNLSLNSNVIGTGSLSVHDNLYLLDTVVVEYTKEQ